MELILTMCPHYCKHGARCRLKPEHDGLHDSRNPHNRENSPGCTWTDEESIPEEDADALMLKTPMGEMLNTIKEIGKLLGYN